MNNITLIIFTDGRAECLQKTWDSFQEHVKGEITHKVMIDDSGNAQYDKWLDTFFPSFSIYHHSSRRGFCKAIQTAWHNIPAGTDFVLHLEDDFLFNRDLNLDDVVSVLKHYPKLSQMALRRQPWNDKEKEAGGILEAVGHENFIDCIDLGHYWMEHRNFFTTNPSVYPVGISKLGWPDAPACEGVFSAKLRELDYVSGFWGRREDGPWVEHIGERIGTGY